MGTSPGNGSKMLTTTNVLLLVRKAAPLLWAAGGALFYAAGFGPISTPRDRLEAIDVRITADSTQAEAQHETFRTVIARSNALLDTLARRQRALAIGECLDRPRRETQLMGLPCENLLNSMIDRGSQ